MLPVVEIETPSRILRRINQHQNDSLASLPPPVDFSNDDDDNDDDDDQDDDDQGDNQRPPNSDSENSIPSHIQDHSSSSSLHHNSNPYTSTPHPSSAPTSRAGTRSLSTARPHSVRSRESLSRHLKVDYSSISKNDQSREDMVLIQSSADDEAAQSPSRPPSASLRRSASPNHSNTGAGFSSAMNSSGSAHSDGDLRALDDLASEPEVSAAGTSHSRSDNKVASKLPPPKPQPRFPSITHRSNRGRRSPLADTRRPLTNTPSEPDETNPRRSASPASHASHSLRPNSPNPINGGSASRSKSPINATSAGGGVYASPATVAESTPGIGRRNPHSKNLSRVSSLLRYQSSSPSSSSSPSPATSSAQRPSPEASSSSSRSRGSLTVDPQTPATATRDQNRSSTDRRAAHLLGALSATAPRRKSTPSILGNGTPRARPLSGGTANRVGSTTTAGGGAAARRVSFQDEDAASRAGGGGGATASEFSVATSTTSHDLTTRVRGQGNTSLPMGVSGSGRGKGGNSHSIVVTGTDATQSRFNNLKLNSYLHKINTELTRENGALTEVLEDREREILKLRKMAKKWKGRAFDIRGGSVGGVGGAGDGADEAAAVGSGTDDDGGDSAQWEEGDTQTWEKLKAIQQTMGDIGRTQGRIVDEILSGSREIADGQDDVAGPVVDELRRMLAARDEEIRTVREELIAERNRQDTDANDQSNSVVANLQREVFDLKDEVAKNEDLVDQLRTERNRTDELLGHLEQKDDELEELQVRFQDAESEFAERMKKVEQEMCDMVEGLEDELDQAARENNRLNQAHEDLIAQRDDAQAMLEQLRSNVDRNQASKEEVYQKLESRITELEKLETSLKRTISSQEAQIHQLENALDDCERQMVTNDEDARRLTIEIRTKDDQLLSQGSKISKLEDQLARASSPSQDSLTKSTHLHRASSPPGGDQSNYVAHLEDKLDQAEREISYLKRATPALTDTKDAQINTLKAAKTELELRVTSLREQSTRLFESTPGPGEDQQDYAGTPQKSLLLRSLKSIRTPKTPGFFLANMTSMGNSPTADATISPLLLQIQQLEAEIEELRLQLFDVNHEVDDKLRKLEDAGLGSLSMAEQLVATQDRISQLEKQLDALVGPYGCLIRMKSRLERVNCPHCYQKVDAAAMVQLAIDSLKATVTFSEQTLQDTSNPGPTAAALQEALSNANIKLSSQKTEWDRERVELQNEVLRFENDASKARRDNATQIAQLKRDRDHEARERELALQESETAAQALREATQETAELENHLQQEREKSRTLSSEKNQLMREKARLNSMFEVQQEELARIKTDLHSRHSSDEIEQLRDEKRALESERSMLQHRVDELDELVGNLDDDLANVRDSLADTQDLLAERNIELHKLKGVGQEKDNKIHRIEQEARVLDEERKKVLREFAAFQADLRRIQTSTMELGDEMVMVREDRHRLESQYTVDNAKFFTMKQALDEAKQDLVAYEKQFSDHVCQNDTAALTAKHSEEAKGLLAMIRYLKIKFARESYFRADLAHQKIYLERIIRDKQTCIDMVLDTLTAMSLESPLPQTRPRPRRSLKTAARAVLAINRMKILARNWKEGITIKTALRSAYAVTRGHPFPPELPSNSF